MWWKIYFWILAIIAGLSIYGIFKQLIEGHISGVLPILETTMYVLAAYAYAYKKRIFPERTWKMWLIIVLMVYVLRWSALWPLDDIWDPVTITIIIFSMIVFPFPAWYGMYRLGFGKKMQAKVTKASKRKTTKRS